MAASASLGRLSFITMIASAVGFATHVATSQRTMPLVGEWMRGREVLRPPYPIEVTLVGACTAVLPTLGALWIGWASYDRLPGRSPWGRGVSLGGLLLLVKGELVRAPIMSMIIGNPWYVALVQQLDKWAANLALGIVLSLGIAWARKAATVQRRLHEAA